MCKQGIHRFWHSRTHVQYFSYKLAQVFTHLELTLTSPVEEQPNKYTEESAFIKFMQILYIISDWIYTSVSALQLLIWLRVWEYEMDFTTTKFVVIVM